MPIVATLKPIKGKQGYYSLCISATRPKEWAKLRSKHRWVLKLSPWRNTRSHVNLVINPGRTRPLDASDSNEYIWRSILYLCPQKWGKHFWRCRPEVLFLNADQRIVKNRDPEKVIEVMRAQACKPAKKKANGLKRIKRIMSVINDEKIGAPSQSRYWRRLSMSTHARPVSGGLPGLGKRG